MREANSPGNLVGHRYGLPKSPQVSSWKFAKLVSTAGQKDHPGGKRAVLTIGESG